MNTKRQLVPEWDEQAYLLKKHFFESNGNPEHIVSLLRRIDIEITNESREFIASVLDGSAKKIGKVKNKYFRNLNIYWSITELINEGLPLTSNSTQEGAACKVAQRFRISEEAAQKIYQRMIPKHPALNDYI